MKKDVKIGLSAGLNTSKDDAPCERGRAYVMNDYIQSLARAGGIPIILPVLSDNELAEKLFDMVDGLILTGGGDLDPTFYGEDPHEKLGSVYRLRDEFELKLLDFAVKKNIPVFGICRGHQIINAYFGGTLYQDVSLCEGAWIKHSQEKLFDYVEHKIKIQENSWLGSFLKTDMSVNTHHHQSVKKLADGFNITATSADGIIEAIEKQKDGKSFCVGVQWHPERMSEDNELMQQLFNEFIKVCKNCRCF